MLPDKQYFKIGEVARLLLLKPSVLRFWETEFPSVRPEKTRSGQRVYAKLHVERLYRIKQLLYEQKYTIAGARAKLREKGSDPDAQQTVRGRVLLKLKEELQELLRLASE